MASSVVWRRRPGGVVGWVASAAGASSSVGVVGWVASVAGRRCGVGGDGRRRRASVWRRRGWAARHAGMGGAAGAGGDGGAQIWVGGA